jgi:hypothetical protein
MTTLYKKILLRNQNKWKLDGKSGRIFYQKLCLQKGRLANDDDDDDDDDDEDDKEQFKVSTNAEFTTFVDGVEPG